MQILNNHKGIALFMVLWVLTLLSVIVAEFCNAMRTEVNITRNFKDEAVAYYIARAGINIALEQILRTGITMNGERGYSDGSIEFRVNTPVGIPFGQGKIELLIANEAGKININRAERSLLLQMLSPFELTEEEKAIIIDSILDWRDEDDLHRLNGAEIDYYRSMTQSYTPSNGDFENVEELLLVRGITPDIFYGGLKDMITIYPKRVPEQRYLEKKKKEKPNIKPIKWYSSDNNHISLNAASRSVLIALFGENAARIIGNFREKDIFYNKNELLGFIDSSDYSRAALFFSLEMSPFFRICSTGLLPGTDVRRSVQVLLEVHPRLDGGYHIIQWWDSVQVCKGIG